MRIVTSLACISLLTALSACAADPDGYYDSNGNWVATGVVNPKVAQDHAPYPGGVYDQRSEYYRDYPPNYSTTTTVYTYDHPGYYDYNGNYVGTTYATPVPVPTDMFPPRGMCRVWFADRAPLDQPPVETCSGIHSRVPSGAYVIYGG